MTTLPAYDLDFDNQAAYQIVVQGRIASGFADLLEGLAITHDTLEEGRPVTILTGVLADQAALSGVLNEIYELHLAIISVRRLR